MSEIIHSDCIEAMAGMAENSVDSIVCDPPYELTSIVKRFGKEGSAPAKHGTDGRFARLGKGFMGKEWDGTGIGLRPEVWRECLRVAKPGAYLLAFGGTRTFHRLACAIEDAGWTLRDTLSWNYGSGFPKSHDVSKALDRKAGAEREVVGKKKAGMGSGKTFGMLQSEGENASAPSEVNVTTPSTPEAKQWNGFGTALKPAWEPVLLFQKPLEGTYAENVLKWGCGALNIDGCRIGGAYKWRASDSKNFDASSFGSGSFGEGPHSQGRWPANFLLSHTVFCEKIGERRAEGYAINRFKDGAKPFGGGAGHPYESEKQGGQMVDVYQCVPDCPVRILDEQSGESKSGGRCGERRGGIWKTGNEIRDVENTTAPSQGGASRFFYCAKTSREERNAGLEAVHTLFEKREGIEEKHFKLNKPLRVEGAREEETDEEIRDKHKNRNSHPTVKPIALMRYLCRLVTPPAGIVLDCFAGSGSTGCAAVLEGFQFIGIEKEKEYAEIARARMAHFSKGKP